jgi:hypothetical protein
MTIGWDVRGPDAIADVATTSIATRAMVALIAAKARRRKRFIIGLVVAGRSGSCAHIPIRPIAATGYRDKSPARLR